MRIKTYFECSFDNVNMQLGHDSFHFAYDSFVIVYPTNELEVNVDTDTRA